LERFAVASQGPGGLKAIVDFRFARCPYYTIVEVEDGEISGVREMQNSHAHTGHGAGIAAAQMLASLGVTAVVAGSIGPNAYSVLRSMNIKVYTGIHGITVEEAVRKIIREEVKPAEAPSRPGWALRLGMGRGMGRGRGGGGGRWRSTSPL